MIKAILFDLDGTLIHSAPGLWHAVNCLRHDYKLAPVGLDKVTPHISFGAKKIIEQSSPELLECDEIGLLEHQALSHYQHTATRDIALYEGVAEALAWLGKKKIPWGIVTNKVIQYTDIILSKIAPLQQASLCICGDTLPNKKPDPDQLILACKELNITPDQCLYIGDSHTDIIASKAIDMPCWLAAYGYIPDMTNSHLLKADQTIEKSTDLISHLQKLLDH